MLADYRGGTLAYRELIVFRTPRARGMVVSTSTSTTSSRCAAGARSGACRRSSPSSQYSRTSVRRPPGRLDCCFSAAHPPPPGLAAADHPGPAIGDGRQALGRPHQGRARARHARRPRRQPVRVARPQRHAPALAGDGCAHDAAPRVSVISADMRHYLRPLFDRVVVKELEPDRIRQSGLLVPPGSHEPPPQHGIVLAVGPGLDWWEHVGVADAGQARRPRRLPRVRRAPGSRSTRSACWCAASASCSACWSPRPR